MRYKVHNKNKLYDSATQQLPNHNTPSLPRLKRHKARLHEKHQEAWNKSEPLNKNNIKEQYHHYIFYWKTTNEWFGQPRGSRDEKNTDMHKANAPLVRSISTRAVSAMLTTPVDAAAVVAMAVGRNIASKGNMTQKRDAHVFPPPYSGCHPSLFITLYDVLNRSFHTGWVEKSTVRLQRPELDVHALNSM